MAGSGPTSNHTTNAEADDGEVMTWRAFAAALPAIHPFSEIGVFALDENRGAGFNQILFWCKELVVGKQHCATDTVGGKIN